jgi:amidohydrolase
MTIINDNLLKRLISIRRTIHEHPELGYSEYKTSQLVADELTSLEIPFKSGIAKTGIVATLKKGEGPLVVLRADMDALPLKEETNLSFASKTNNTMHACGHDVHTTMLLGAVHLLKEKKFEGTVKFIFQPSEEGIYDDPEKKSGGQRIAESGELNGAAAALGLHVHPLIPVGTIAYKLGNALACTDTFRINVNGKSAHAGAAPQLGIDAILVAGHLIQAVQSIVSRYTSPTEPVVFSITKIHGGVAANIIADKVNLEGTIRTLDLDVRNNVIERLKKIIEGLSISFGAEITLEFDLSYPSLVNDRVIHSKLSASLDSVFGKNNVIETEAMLGGEDFAFYSRKIPSMFYFIGARDKNDPVYFVHHPSVIINEDCIPLGSTFLTNGALELMNNYRN